MTDTKDLVDFVYYKMLNKEIQNQKDNSRDNEIILKGIKEVDGIKCYVTLCVNYRTYMLRIQSENLIEDCCDYDNKIYLRLEASFLISHLMSSILKTRHKSLLFLLL